MGLRSGDSWASNNLLVNGSICLWNVFNTDFAPGSPQTCTDLPSHSIGNSSTLTAKGNSSDQQSSRSPIVSFWQTWDASWCSSCSINASLFSSEKWIQFVRWWCLALRSWAIKLIFTHYKVESFRITAEFLSYYAPIRLTGVVSTENELRHLRGLEL